VLPSRSNLGGWWTGNTCGQARPSHQRGRTSRSD